MQLWNATLVQSSFHSDKSNQVRLLERYHNKHDRHDMPMLTSSSNLTTLAWALLSAWSLISMCLLWSSVVERKAFNSISSLSFSRCVSLSVHTWIHIQKGLFPSLFWKMELSALLLLNSVMLWSKNSSLIYFLFFIYTTQTHPKEYQQCMHIVLGSLSVLVFHTLCKKLRDGFTVVLCAFTVSSSKLLVGSLHAL